MGLRRRRTVGGLVLAGILSVSPFAWGSVLKGTIRVKPPYSASSLITIDQKHQEHCGQAAVSEKLKISPAGGVSNVVVSLAGEFPENRAESAAAAGPYLMRQKECQFLPHVLLAPKNHPFRITNEDPMAHDVRAFWGSKLLFWHQMEMGQKPIEEKLNVAGPVVFRCGLHKWMHAFVISMEHPYYALTDEEGEYQLSGLPAGKFQVRFWHEVLGEESQEVLLEGEQSHALDFEFPPPKET